MIEVTPVLLDRVERCYDAIPRVFGARAEAVGPFELFVRDGAGWPFYARPRRGATTITAADVRAVRARQRELHAPEAIEWVVDVTPSLHAAVEESGMSVMLAPLMVLEPDRLPADDGTASVLDPDASDFADVYAESSAVAHLGFGAEDAGSGSTEIGAAGPAERDAATRPVPADLLALIAADLRTRHRAEAVVAVPGDGIVSRGAMQSALGAAEIVGVATLPAARRRGYGAAVSALLARTALERGNDVVFLSAASEAVTRVYARIGFRRIGTAGIAEARAPH